MEASTCNIHEHRFAKICNELVDAHVEAKCSQRREGYVCVTCPTPHSVILKRAQHERYKISAWFSHVNAQPSVGGGAGESLLHLHAKYLLQSQVGRYKFTGSICSSCHVTTVVSSQDCAVQIEAFDAPYRYDALLCQARTQIAVMEVWNTHETDSVKREHVLRKGMVFAEFKADHIVEMLDPDYTAQMPVVLENLKPGCEVCDICERFAAWQAEVSTIQKFNTEVLLVWEAALNQRAACFRAYKQARWLEWCDEITLLQMFDRKLCDAMERIVQTKKRKRKHDEITLYPMQEVWEREIRQLQKFDMQCFFTLSKLLKDRQVCKLAPNCGCHGFRRPDPLTVHRHEREHTRRLAWCIKHNRIPAHDHVHEAPGDDSQFVYGVAPWFTDGSVNPAGVYYSPDTDNEQEWVRLEKEARDAGWSCPRCGVWVARVPVDFKHGAEPWDWWFCTDCKQIAVKPSQKELKAQQLSRVCQKMECFAGFAARNPD